MSDIPEFEDKLPHTIDCVLSQLYQVIQALKSSNFKAALNHASDALASVQNEIDWCYRTDRTLPFVREFLIQLGDAITTIEKVVPGCRRDQVSAIIQVVESVSTQVSNLIADAARWHEPDKYIDSLERDHRARTYPGSRNGE